MSTGTGYIKYMFFSDWLKYSSIKPSRRELQKKQENSVFVIIMTSDRIVTVIKQRKNNKLIK